MWYINGYLFVVGINIKFYRYKISLNYELIFNINIYFCNILLAIYNIFLKIFKIYKNLLYSVYGITIDLNEDFVFISGYTYGALDG